MGECVKVVGWLAFGVGKWLSVSYALMAICCGGNNFGVNAKVRDAYHALELRRVEDIRRGGSLGIEDHYASNALKAMCRLEVKATGSLGADLR